MTHKLPPNLLALFAARPTLKFLPPSDHAPEERKTNNIGGVAQYLEAIQEYKETVPYKPTESWLQRKDRIKQEKKERQERLLTEERGEDPNVRGDAFKTLFVARLSYDTTEKDLEREFGRFGPIERIRIVADTTEPVENGKESKKKKKPHRGYAFVVYEREKDMKGTAIPIPKPQGVIAMSHDHTHPIQAAYKETDGIRIKDRRVLVDVERGRTVKGWRPRRLGGGLGGRGYTKAMPVRPTGIGGGFSAPAGPGGFAGGFRGGFQGGPRGGFRGGFRGGDRPDFRGGRGGIGYQGGGGFGGRGGYGGGPPNGYGGSPAPPPNAPSGPGGRGGFGGGYGASPPTNGGMNGSAYGTEPRRNDYDDRSSYRGGGGGGGGYGDRAGGITGSNREPVRPRESGGYGDRGYGDRDRDRGYGGRDDSRKRQHDGDGYEDPRKQRRY